MNKSKAAGTRAETAVVRFLEEREIQARRKALAGSHDEGDVEVIGIPRFNGSVVLEIKAGKQTINPNRSLLTEWLRQAKKEGEQSNQFPFLVVVRYKHKLADADVWFETGKVRHHLYLDELPEYLAN